MSADLATRIATCPLCEALCGILVEVEGRRIRSVRGDPDDPFSRGYICPKAAALADLHDDPDRIRTPLVRERLGLARRRPGRRRWIALPADSPVCDGGTAATPSASTTAIRSRTTSV